MGRVARSIEKSGRFLGKISYSLYVTHYPVVIFAVAAWIAVMGALPRGAELAMLVVPCALVVGTCSWFLVERHCTSTTKPAVTCFGWTFGRLATTPTKMALIRLLIISRTGAQHPLRARQRIADDGQHLSVLVAGGPIASEAAHPAGLRSEVAWPASHRMSKLVRMLTQGTWFSTSQ